MKKVRLLLAAALVFVLAPASVLAVDYATDVEGLEVTETYSNAVTLEWEPAAGAGHEGGETAGYIVHYGTSTVDEMGEVYDDSVDVGNVTSYVVSGLDTGTTYYFSVVAYDTNDPRNESRNWASEASATPEADMDAYEGDDDGEAPKVSSVEATDMKTVRVTFSEAVELPATATTAFSIENQDNFEALAVEAAKVDASDKKVVVLTTAEQEAGVEYKVTAGVEVEDMAGNPVVSGTSDTGVFEGSSVDPAAEEFKIAGVQVVDNENVVVDFTRTVDLSTDPSTNFEIVSADDETVKAPVNSVTLGNGSYGEDSSVIIGTELEDGKKYVLKVMDLTDSEGNEMSEEYRTYEFGEGEATTEEDDEETDENSEEEDDEDQDLVESGPGMIGLLALSLGFGGVVGRRKNKKM